jgi:hypothetical protein
MRTGAVPSSSNHTVKVIPKGLLQEGGHYHAAVKTLRMDANSGLVEVLWLETLNRDSPLKTLFQESGPFWSS